MTVLLSSALPVSAQTVFEQVKRPAMLHYVAHPIIRFLPQQPFPAVWLDGVYETRMRLFDTLPLGRQLIRIEIPANPVNGPFQLRDNGQGHLVRTWDHWITVSTITPDRCLYTDTVTIRAGLLTPFMWLFALVFYAWRQYRWKQAVQINFQPTDHKS